ncbi:MAG: 30S ribosomal protein S17e [Candidatus Altiarchaeota archaeon]
MGRIKQTYLKRIAGKLLKDRGEIFNTEFEHNKKAVQENTDITSKSIRNKIAGYVTRVVKNRAKEESS